MINDYIKSRIHNYRTIIANFGYLGMLQALNMLVPLLLFPYLIRILGVETYGLVVFAQAVISYFVVMVNFGFNITATKEISFHRNDEAEVTEVITSVFFIKGCLFILSLVLLSVVLYFLPQANTNKTLFYLTMHMCLFEWLFPVWYFQGKEIMKHIALFNFLGKIVFVLLIIIMVKNTNDYLWTPISQGVGNVLVICLSFYFLLKRHGFSFLNKPNRKRTIKLFHESKFLFLSNFTTLAKDKTNVVLLGILLTTKEVAYYDLVSRIVAIITSFYDIVATTVFPYAYRQKNRSFIQKILCIIIVYSVVAYILLNLFSEQIISLLGGEAMIPSVELVPYFGLWIIIVSISATIGRLVLLVNDLHTAYLMNIVYTLVFYLVIAFVLVSLEFFYLDTAVYLIIATVLFELLHRLFLCRKYL